MVWPRPSFFLPTFCLTSKCGLISGGLLGPCSPKIAAPGPGSVCKDIWQKKEHLCFPSTLTMVLDWSLVWVVCLPEPFFSWNERKGYADWHQLIRAHSWNEEVIGGRGRGQFHRNGFVRKFAVYQKAGTGNGCWGYSQLNAVGKLFSCFRIICFLSGGDLKIFLELA